MEDVAGLEPAAPCSSGRGMRGTLQRYFIETNMVGGRGRNRTGDHLLAKRGAKFAKSCRSRRNPLKSDKL